MTGTVLMTLVVAMGENGVIGRDGAMPWHLSSDLKRFKALTLGRPVVMGRKTFASIGRPLPGRDNLVVSRDPDFRPEGVTVFGEVETALQAARRLAGEKGVEDFAVVGGGALYAATIDRADRLMVTRVLASPEGDTRFPPIDPARWRLAASEPMLRGPRDDHDAVYESWVRRDAL